MSAQMPWAQAQPPSQMYAPPQTYDPNMLLRRIDQTTTQIFHWVRIGVVVLILLAIVSIFI
jgi:hypothetical protein